MLLSSSSSIIECQHAYAFSCWPLISSKLEMCLLAFHAFLMRTLRRTRVRYFGNSDLYFSLSLCFIVLIFTLVIHKISRQSWRYKFRIYWQLRLTNSVITVVIIRPSCRSRISKIRYLFAKIWSSPRLFRKFKLFAKISISLSQDHSYYVVAYCNLSRVQTQSLFLWTSV